MGNFEKIIPTKMHLRLEHFPSIIHIHPRHVSINNLSIIFTTFKTFNRCTAISNSMNFPSTKKTDHSTFPIQSKLVCLVSSETRDE